MVKKGTYKVYLVRINDWWIRITFAGYDHREQRRWLRAISDDIVYLGTLPLPIKSDVDTGSGEGRRMIGKSRIVTCVHCQQMITKKESEESMLTIQRKAIDIIRESQEEFLRKLTLKDSLKDSVSSIVN